MGVANLIEVSNSVTLGNLISAQSSPAFVKSVMGVNLMYVEDLPSGTNVKKFVKDGSMTAASSTAESTAVTIGAAGELTDDSVTATAAKVAISSGITVEEERFGYIDVNRVAEAQGNSIARAVDNDWLAMATNLSTVVTAASVLTINDLFLAQLNIFNSNCPRQDVPLAAVLGPRAVYNIKTELLTSGASAWTNPGILGLFGGQPIQANNFVGRLAGNFDVYQTTGFSTTGGDDQQMVFHPMFCFAGMFDTAPQVWVTPRGAEGLYTEVVSYLLYDIIEWNDLAGVQVRSDT